MVTQRLWQALVACVMLCLSATVSAAPSSNRITNVLIRYPTMHGDTIVFEAGGRLWKTTTTGGTAIQLTPNNGFAMVPHISPDGHWVAFSGKYQGNTDVYVMPLTGGPLKRLTFYKGGGKDMVVGWTPDGRNVVFLSSRDSFNPRARQAYQVPITGGLPTQLPLPWTGPLSFNITGHQVAYNKLPRSYAPYHRKHYYGGEAQDIWIYDFDTSKSRQITHWKGADVWPMWHGDTIYFTSDRGPQHVQNLWSYSLKADHFTQLTHFATYDIDSPTLGNDGIAFSGDDGL